MLTHLVAVCFRRFQRRGANMNLLLEASKTDCRWKRQLLGDGEALDGGVGGGGLLTHLVAVCFRRFQRRVN